MHYPVRLLSAGAILLLTLLLPLEAAKAQPLPAIAQTDPAARLAEGDRLLDLGVQQFNANQLDAALQSWLQALSLYQDSGVQTTFTQAGLEGEGLALASLGTLANRIGQNRQAIIFYNQSLVIFRELGDWQRERVTLSSLGNVYRDLEQYPEALEFYAQSLEIARDRGDTLGEGIVLNHFGTTYSALDNHLEAANYFQEALSVFQTLQDSQIQNIILITLQNLGVIYGQLGEHREAANFYRQGLNIARSLGAREAEKNCLHSLGNNHFLLGQYQDAIDAYNQGLNIARTLSDHESIGDFLGDLAGTYHALGRYGKAQSLYEEALDIFREINDLDAIGKTLANLGVNYISLGKFEEAIELHEQFIINFFRNNEDREGEGKALGNLGLAYFRLGNYGKAIEFLEQSLAIAQERDDRFLEGMTLNNLGAAYERLGRYQEALDLHNEALILARETEDRAGEGLALNNLGVSFYYLNEFSLSSNALMEAINIYESLQASSLLDVDKVSFFDTYLRSYLSLQRSLIAQNFYEEALVFAERGRARAFIDLLARRAFSSGNTEILTSSLFEPLKLSDIQRVAREQNATLIEYSVFSFPDLPDSVLYIWVVQPTGDINFEQIDLTDTDLTELVSLARQSMGVRSQDRATVEVEISPEVAAQQQAQRQQKLRQLHHLLIEPIAQHLPRDPYQRVVFIPHQDLFLVPFAALVNAEGEYLIENHTILTAPSIQVLDLTRQQRLASGADSRSLSGVEGNENGNTLVVGNPTMPIVWNPRTEEMERLSSLSGAQEEAVAIAKELDTEALLLQQATKADVVRLMPSARLIHLATHGLLEYGTPEDSGVLDVPGAIALAPSDDDNGLLTSAEILQMDLSADLVVLSACDTGRGRITGDGVIGLSRAFVTAGVPSLVVSLWAVDDAATADLMVAFYDNWQQTGDKAQALRHAMLTTLKDHPDPRLWAAFTLIGSAE
jgi:CHAT domain-containing protein/Flp pilus assembly protein TadD